MSSFFKAASRCDQAALERSPICIDRKELIEEEIVLNSNIRRWQLEDSLRMIRELDKVLGPETVVSASPARHSDESTYVPPPQLTQGLPPEQRQPGANARLAALLERLEQQRAARQEDLGGLKLEEMQATSREAADEEQWRSRQEHLLQATFTAQRILAETEAQLQLQPNIDAIKAQRKVHPIDVLHQRIAAVLMDSLRQQDLEAEAAAT